MAKFNLILDANIHRCVTLGVNVSKDAKYSVIPIDLSGKNFLEIKSPHFATPIQVESKRLFTPPNIGVKIAYDPSVHDQYLCELDDKTTRVFEIGTELSTDVKVSIMVIHAMDRTSGIPVEYLLINDDSGIQQIETSNDIKIPPNTGKTFRLVEQESKS